MPSGPTLQVSRSELLRHLARFVGWDRNFDTWQPNQHADAQDILARALRQAYNPDILPGEVVSHRFSFLRPIGHIQTKANVGDYDLPPDFGGLIGNLTFSDSSTGCMSVERVGEQRIRELRQPLSTTTGYPQYYCIVPLATGESSQRWQLRVWPIAGEEYRLEFRYYSNPLQLTEDAPFPCGGQPFAECLVASVIAAADAVLHDDPLGASYENFITKLKAAVSHDRQEMESRLLGYFGNNQPLELPSRTRRVSYEGVYYTEES